PVPPGAPALRAPLTLPGLPPAVFLFGGFLPPRQAARRRVLDSWSRLAATLVFFESAARLAGCLADMADVLGNRPAAMARELTKVHEEMRRGRLVDLAAHYRDAGPPRGEVVIVVGAPEPSTPDDAEVGERLRAALAALGGGAAAALVAAETGLPRRELYRRGGALRGGRR